MEVIVRITSLVDDVFGLVFGEQLSTPAEQAIKQYPYLFMV